MQSLWMLVASLLFACMGVCVKLAAATHSAVEITFYRSFISLLIMFVLVRLRGVRLATPHWRWQISRGVVGFAALFAYFYAIILLPLATAVTLNYTSAIFLAIYLALAGMRMSG
ncbi:MAG TPA: EamA family transporter, partial [Azonexus sp.]|nr:EamA family transporter [Azonexus sp.]